MNLLVRKYKMQPHQHIKSSATNTAIDGWIDVHLVELFLMATAAAAVRWFSGLIDGGESERLRVLAKEEREREKKERKKREKKVEVECECMHNK